MTVLSPVSSISCVSAAIAIALTTFSAVPAQALDFDFSGSFLNDNDVQSFDFTVGADSTITLFSSSWLYGDAPSGESLGGFDPILILSDEWGNIIFQQDDGGVEGATVSNGVSYNHGVWDSYFSQFLTAGSYIATIAQFDNFPIGSNLSDGFLRGGSPTFTADEGFGGATQPKFNGVWDDSDPRTSHWAFHILNVADAGVVDPTPVPEPSLLLGLVGMGAIWWTRRGEWNRVRP